MKRRNFTLMAGTSLLAMAAPRHGTAQAADFASLSKTTLTPLGSERAGNAAGSIPAWTGGYTSIPAGWSPDQEMPDLFAGEAPVAIIDATNLAQNKDRLAEGTQYMIQNYGFSLKIFPTHRTAAAPQYVYDNIAANAVRAKIEPTGPQLGFSNAYGGIPFPVLAADPLVAGAQILWNHNSRWQGYYQTRMIATFVVEHGGSPILTCGQKQQNIYPYYDPNGTLETFSGYQYKVKIMEFAPSVNIGTEIIATTTTDPLLNPVISWELLAGQGRVRKTPELQYDTPDSFTNGLTQFDEVYGMNGALDKYDWRLAGKKEMYIPYNNNKMSFATRAEIAGPKFLNPDIVRWELHRVWVVDATLHPGERNVIARRRFYVDEDTWTIALAECWDASGNLWKEDVNYNVARPDLPGTVRLWTVSYNLQSNAYVLVDGTFNDPGFNAAIDFHTPILARVYDANVMAADASY